MEKLARQKGRRQLVPAHPPDDDDDDSQSVTSSMGADEYEGVKKNRQWLNCTLVVSGAGYIIALTYLIVSLTFGPVPVIPSDLFSFIIPALITTILWARNKESILYMFMALVGNVIQFVLLLVGYLALSDAYTYENLASTTNGTFTWGNNTRIVLDATVASTYPSTWVMGTRAVFWLLISCAGIIGVAAVLMMMEWGCINCGEGSYEDGHSCASLMSHFRLAPGIARRKVKSCGVQVTVNGTLAAIGLSLSTILAHYLIILCALGEQVPFWTNIPSPHFGLEFGMLVLALPPFGETHLYTPKRTSPRFILGMILLVVGLIFSTIAIVLDIRRVVDTGANWLEHASYMTMFDCTARNSFIGGYTWSCTTPNKLVDYALGHHVIELLLVCFGYALLAMMSITWGLNRVTKV